MKARQSSFAIAILAGLSFAGSALGRPAVERTPETTLQFIATQSYVYTSLALAQGFKAGAALNVSSDERALVFHIHHADREIQMAKREISRLRASDSALGRNTNLIEAEEDLWKAHTINQEIVTEISQLADVRALAGEQLDALNQSLQALLRAANETQLQALPPPGYKAFLSSQGT